MANALCGPNCTVWSRIHTQSSAFRLGRVNSYSPSRNNHMRAVLAQGVAAPPGSQRDTIRNTAAKLRWPARVSNNPRVINRMTPGE